MNATRFTLSVLAVISLSFRPAPEIDRCFMSTKTISGLKPAKPDRLPEAARTGRTVTTEAGSVTISRIDGYRILYNNRHGAPFVNVKVELAADGAYGADTANILANLAYLASRSTGTESRELIRLRYNGYLVSGFSRSQIDSGANLGTFVMFPGKGITVYLYFQNLRPGYRHFESLEDYKAQRNAFLGEYTDWLVKCRD